MHALRFSIVMTLIAIAIVAIVTPLKASELDGMMEMCDKKMCPWFKTRATPPKGWIENPEWSLRYKAKVMFKDGDQSKNAPLMYVRSHPGDAALPLDDYIAVAQKRWKEELKTSSIEPQPDVVREGKPAFKVFLYKNPDVPEQALELTAFTKDTDSAHKNQTYFQQVVLVAPNKKVLGKAKAAFEALLRSL